MEEKEEQNEKEQEKSVDKTPRENLDLLRTLTEGAGLQEEMDVDPDAAVNEPSEQELDKADEPATEQEEPEQEEPEKSQEQKPDPSAEDDEQQDQAAQSIPAPEQEQPQQIQDESCAPANEDKQEEKLKRLARKEERRRKRIEKERKRKELLQLEDKEVQTDIQDIVHSDKQSENVFNSMVVGATVTKEDDQSQMEANASERDSGIFHDDKPSDSDSKDIPVVTPPMETELSPGISDMEDKEHENIIAGEHEQEQTAVKEPETEIVTTGALTWQDNVSDGQIDDLAGVIAKPTENESDQDMKPTESLEQLKELPTSPTMSAEAKDVAVGASQSPQAVDNAQPKEAQVDDVSVSSSEDINTLSDRLVIEAVANAKHACMMEYQGTVGIDPDEIRNEVQRQISEQQDDNNGNSDAAESSLYQQSMDSDTSEDTDVTIDGLISASVTINTPTAPENKELDIRNDVKLESVNGEMDVQMDNEIDNLPTTEPLGLQTSSPVRSIDEGGTGVSIPVINDDVTDHMLASTPRGTGDLTLDNAGPQLDDIGVDIKTADTIDQSGPGTDAPKPTMNGDVLGDSPGPPTTPALNGDLLGDPPEPPKLYGEPPVGGDLPGDSPECQRMEARIMLPEDEQIPLSTQEAVLDNTKPPEIPDVQINGDADVRPVTTSTPFTNMNQSLSSADESIMENNNVVVTNADIHHDPSSDAQVADISLAMNEIELAANISAPEVAVTASDTLRPLVEAEGAPMITEPNPSISLDGGDTQPDMATPSQDIADLGDKKLTLYMAKPAVHATAEKQISQDIDIDNVSSSNQTVPNIRTDPVMPSVHDSTVSDPPVANGDIHMGLSVGNSGVHGDLTSNMVDTKADQELNTQMDGDNKLTANGIPVTADMDLSVTPAVDFHTMVENSEQVGLQEKDISNAGDFPVELPSQQLIADVSSPKMEIQSSVSEGKVGLPNGNVAVGVSAEPPSVDAAMVVEPPKMESPRLERCSSTSSLTSSSSSQSDTKELR